MSNLLLKLEDGQKLRLLPISEDMIYNTVKEYYINKLEKLFIHDSADFVDFDNREAVPRFIRNYIPVEYNDEIYFIKFGMRIKDKIDKIVNHYNLKPVDFLYNTVFLQVELKEVGIGAGRTVTNFDSCVVDVSDIKDFCDNESDFFNSKQYTTVKELYDRHISFMRIENKPDIIDHLNQRGLLKPEFAYLLRTKKINDIRSRKVTTTKLELWNQVSKVVAEADEGSERIEDIGFHKVDDKGEEVHQFMVDGYLFEVKLKDKV